jgi:hypothetical protein
MLTTCVPSVLMNTNVPISSTDQPSHGSILLHDDPSLAIPQPDTEIYVTDSPHPDSAIFSLTINHLPLHYLGCQLGT